MVGVKTYSNKKDILDRILEFAANIQGVSKSELLDPVIVLFLESLAEEIYRLSGEIDNLESRVLDKISSMLISDLESVAYPAHSILHATPLEGIFNLTTTTEFELKQNNQLSIYPICNTLLYKGDIKYFVYDRYFYSVDKELTKTLITRSGQHDSSSNSFWIGLELDAEITIIENLSFYINIPKGYKQTNVIDHLSRAQWILQNTPIKTVRGLYTLPKNEVENKQLELFESYDYSNRINNKVKDIYDKYFITIKDQINISDKREVFPNQLEDCFPKDFQKSFQQGLIWFKIVYPPNLTEDVIRNIDVSINAFPIVSKQLITQIVETNKYIPIIPLETKRDESFLSVRSLTDSNGLSYYDVPLSEYKEQNYGIYSLRNGGYERFNSRDAKEFLINITRHIDSEAASFFRNSKDANTEQTLLQADVNKMIRDLKKISSSAKPHFEIKNYLLIEQERDSEIYFLEYWVTNNMMVNTIEEGAFFRSSSGLQIDPLSTILYKPLVGGKQTPSQMEKYSLYKHRLTGHSLLISNEDIRQFCINSFPEVVSEIEIRQGYEKHSNPKIQFLRTTDIYIKTHNHLIGKIDKKTRNYIKHILEKNSPATFNYRVIINKQ